MSNPQKWKCDPHPAATSLEPLDDVSWDQSFHEGHQSSQPLFLQHPNPGLSSLSSLITTYLVQLLDCMTTEGIQCLTHFHVSHVSQSTLK